MPKPPLLFYPLSIVPLGQNKSQRTQCNINVEMRRFLVVLLKHQIGELMLMIVRMTPMATAKKSKTSPKLRVKACSGVLGSAIASAIIDENGRTNSVGVKFISRVTSTSLQINSRFVRSRWLASANQEGQSEQQAHP